MSILITGGSKGIGRGIAERFAAPGVQVFINYAHDTEAAEAAADAVNRRGATAVLLKRDITGAQAATALLAEVAEHTDRLDQLVHGAVYPYSSRLLDSDPSELDKAISLNGTAIVHLSQAAMPLFRQGSTVFFLSSRGSKFAIPNYAALGAPKAMAEALIRYLAIELAEHGVRTHVVSPSLVLTDALRKVYDDAEQRAEAAAALNPMKRNVNENDVANLVYFLASPEAAMLTGREFVIDGGAYSKPG
ncbi:MAG: SDR family oxidoreductase [Actinomycetota bacterium]|jgi:NAD(P)-dependent dehydrogenase (short-subunit alcohol dehydrogenase family)|nr:SDR family oxidoreductase [Actinomycetota bacterium]